MRVENSFTLYTVFTLVLLLVANGLTGLSRTCLRCVFRPFFLIFILFFSVSLSLFNISKCFPTSKLDDLVSSLFVAVLSHGAEHR